MQTNYIRTARSVLTSGRLDTLRERYGPDWDPADESAAQAAETRVLDVVRRAYELPLDGAVVVLSGFVVAAADVVVRREEVDTEDPVAQAARAALDEFWTDPSDRFAIGRALRQEVERWAPDLAQTHEVPGLVSALLCRHGSEAIGVGNKLGFLVGQRPELLARLGHGWQATV